MAAPIEREEPVTTATLPMGWSQVDMMERIGGQVKSVRTEEGSTRQKYRGD